MRTSRMLLTGKGRLEHLEDRLVMSGEPLATSLGGAADHHVQVGPPPIAHGGDIEHHLFGGHQQSGLFDVRNDYGLRGSGQTVAIIDSGIAYDHPALGGGIGGGFRVVGGRDFTLEADDDPYDDGPEGSHGTHVAGIVGADNGSVDGPGVAPAVDFVGLRVFDDVGNGYFRWVEDALAWVHDHRNDFQHPITTAVLSLGTDWNDDGPPDWAMLEDVLAQLAADGIFISVAAGNSFTDYCEPGLSYPAASPYVVPAMSTDDDGSLSYFSQRHSSAIAAPGRWIYSTVPDYVGNHNGVTDDWATYSGTSMAAPYLAGASVLVREALQFVGHTEVSQDLIYNHIRATADTVFDDRTDAPYYRLNLKAAIDALMPADDYGSTLETAHDLGTLGTSTQVAGLIGTLSDADYFTFTAGATGTVTFTATTTHDLSAAWQVEGSRGSAGRVADETFTFDVVAGQDYTVGLSSTGGIGYYDLSASLEAWITPVNWGNIVFAEHTGVDNFGGESWYRMQTSGDGLLTVEAFFDAGTGDVDLLLYDDRMNMLAESATNGGSERVQAAGASGDVFYLRVVGGHVSVDFRLSNLVHVDKQTVHVSGTDGDDQVQLALGETHLLLVNGVAYAFAATDVVRFVIDAGGGSDQIKLSGTAGDDAAVLRPGQLSFTSPTVDVTAASFERAVVEGGGGRDQASFFDSVANDLFQARSGAASLSGNGFYNHAAGFARISTYATAGGYDEARMYDSNENDLYRAWSTHVEMIGSGVIHIAQGFERTRGFADSGGYDEARIYDTPGDDIYEAQPLHVALSGTGFLNIAEGFERARAFATAGGYDEARLYDTPGDDVYEAWSTHAQISGNGFLNIVESFERTRAFATAGGYDEARLYDSAGNDMFQAWPTHAQLNGSGFFNIAASFERTRAFAIADGYDEARLYDSPGNDMFQTWSTHVQMRGGGFFNIAERFERSRGFATAGGYDEVRMYDTVHDDLFRTWHRRASMSGRGYLNEADGFEYQRGWSSSGNDEARFYDCVADDRAIARAWGAYLESGSTRSQACDFASVRVFGENGGNNTADVEAVDYLFQLVGKWT